MTTTTVTTSATTPTDDVWSVGRILAWIEDYLAKHGDSQPRTAAQWLVSEALAVSRMQLYLDLERPLSADERALLRDWTRRRAAGEPLQYITGQAAFRHITIDVAPGVLIPRPETEVLVSEALALLPPAEKPQDAFDADVIEAYLAFQKETHQHSAYETAARDAAQYSQQETLKQEALEELPQDATLHASQARHQQLRVADICTGSGCIACSLAYEHAAVHVVATDIDPTSVALAQRNVEKLDLADRICVLESDIGATIPQEWLGTLDLVVSNPPYIPTALLQGLEHQVKDFEPQIALDGGDDGLHVFRRILVWAKEALRPGGGIACELHEECLSHAAAEAEYEGFSDVRIIEDLAGKPRVLTARLRTK